MVTCEDTHLEMLCSSRRIQASQIRDARKPAYVRIATFRSAGEDGAFETHDDIVWRVMADGSTSE